MTTALADRDGPVDRHPPPRAEDSGRDGRPDRAPCSAGTRPGRVRRRSVSLPRALVGIAQDVVDVPQAPRQRRPGPGWCAATVRGSISCGDIGSHASKA